MNNKSTNSNLSFFLGHETEMKVVLPLQTVIEEDDDDDDDVCGGQDDDNEDGSNTDDDIQQQNKVIHSTPDNPVTTCV